MDCEGTKAPGAAEKTQEPELSALIGSLQDLAV
jgi:hypothetical protein